MDFFFWELDKRVGKREGWMVEGEAGGKGEWVKQRRNYVGIHFRAGDNDFAEKKEEEVGCCWLWLWLCDFVLLLVFLLIVYSFFTGSSDNNKISFSPLQRRKRNKQNKIRRKKRKNRRKMGERRKKKREKEQ